MMSSCIEVAHLWQVSEVEAAEEAALSGAAATEERDQDVRPFIVRCVPHPTNFEPLGAGISQFEYTKRIHGCCLARGNRAQALALIDYGTSAADAVPTANSNGSVCHGCMAR